MMMTKCPPCYYVMETRFTATHIIIEALSSIVLTLGINYRLPISFLSFLSKYHDDIQQRASYFRCNRWSAKKFGTIEANQVAHYLAKYTFSISSYDAWIEETPCIDATVAFDLMPHSRMNEYMFLFKIIFHFIVIRCLRKINFLNRR